MQVGSRGPGFSGPLHHALDRARAALQGYSLTPSPVPGLCRWVASDLASVDRSVTPWIVLGLHRMMWAPATWRHDEVGDLDNEERLQADLEELFIAHGVSKGVDSMDGRLAGQPQLWTHHAAACSRTRTNPFPCCMPRNQPLPLANLDPGLSAASSWVEHQEGAP